MSDAQGSDDMTESAADEGVEENVEGALREFLDALGESDTYQRFVAADEALQEDADAMALLRESVLFMRLETEYKTRINLILRGCGDLFLFI